MIAFKRAASLAALVFVAASALSAFWVESMEFPWPSYPRQLWERELVWMKNIGITHVSLPPGDGAPLNAQLKDVIGIVRRLGLEADLEGPVPDELTSLTVEHGGPLTAPPSANSAKLSALDPDAAVRSRDAVASGAPALIWTGVEDTAGAPEGFHSGAVNFTGQGETGDRGLTPQRETLGLLGGEFRRDA